MLIQENKVSAYASTQWKVYESNYSTHDLQLTSLVFALKIERHYLYRAWFTMFNDHKNLKYLLDQKEFKRVRGGGRNALGNTILIYSTIREGECCL